MEVVVGNAASAQVLELANIEAAKCLMIAIPNGFEAGTVCETGRKLNPAIRIIARAHSTEEEAHLRHLGADTVIMGEREIGLGMLAWLRGDRADDTSADAEPLEPRLPPVENILEAVAAQPGTVSGALPSAVIATDNEPTAAPEPATVHAAIEAPPSPEFDTPASVSVVEHPQENGVDEATEATEALTLESERGVVEPSEPSPPAEEPPVAVTETFPDEEEDALFPFTTEPVLFNPEVVPPDEPAVGQNAAPLAEDVLQAEHPVGGESAATVPEVGHLVSPDGTVVVLDEPASEREGGSVEEGADEERRSREEDAVPPVLPEPKG